MSGLSVLVPIAITDAMFTSSTAPENDYPVWVAGSYAVGYRCISTVTHRIYESLIASNTKDPTDILNRTGTTPAWLDIGATNKWACLDGLVSTPTKLASPLTMVFTPGFFNALCLFGLDAENLAITVKDAPGGNVIYSDSGALESSAPGDWYEYFFDPFKPQTDFVASEIPPYNNAEVTITLTSATADVACGMLQMGDLRPLGETQYGAKAKPKTFSYIKINDFGENEIVRRKKAKDMTLSAWLKLEEANSVLETVGDMLDIPCMWIGTDLPEYTGLRVFGLGSGEVSYDHPQDCLLTVDVKGLI
ncbi:MAG TPA: hypothetical protein VFQ99_04170 [Gallionella sp.]|nr:hypothetical protein [Gallionella sp.]